MSEYEWTCAGCGVPSPDRERRCACPTNVVVWDRKHAWKLEAYGDKEPVPVTGIHLKRVGDRAVVAIEIDGKWVDVIEEHYDGNFSHICEPNGMRRRASETEPS